MDEATVKYLYVIANNRRSEGIDNEGEARKETKKPDTEQCRRAVPLTPDIPHLVGLFMVLTALGKHVEMSFSMLSDSFLVDGTCFTTSLSARNRSTTRTTML